MAKFLVFSDFHMWRAWPEWNPVMPSGLTKRLEIQLDVWKQIEKYALSYNVLATLFAGDLTNKRSYLHTTEINTLLELYKKSPVRHILIGGNHDRFSVSFNAVQALNGIGNTTVLPSENGDVYTTFLEPKETITISGATPGGKLPPVPFVTQDGEHPKRVNILLAHGILNGAKSQNGFELEGGYAIKDFEGWDLVCMGDIHKKQLHENVLIPGSTQQMNWGDCALECGCWLIDTEHPKMTSLDIDKEWKWKEIGTCYAKFLPLHAPKFIKVTKETFPAVSKIEFDDFNYYDFRLTQEIDKPLFKELKRRFPNSYITVTEAKREKSKVSISQKTNSPKEILEKYYDLRVNGKQKTEFVDKGISYLMQADPTQLSSTHKALEIESIRAENFLCFEKVELDFNELKRSLYQITGSSDDETSDRNGVGKSALISEMISFGLYGTLCRSANRSKDRIIFDPSHSGKGKNMLIEIVLKVGEQRYLIQRYRKHSVLGTGSRILKETGGWKRDNR
jgi:predicted phosphodiesterase